MSVHLSGWKELDVILFLVNEITDYVTNSKLFSPSDFNNLLVIIHL